MFVSFLREKKAIPSHCTKLVLFTLCNSKFYLHCLGYRVLEDGRVIFEVLKVRITVAIILLHMSV